MLQRNVGLLLVLGMQYRMSVGEGASSHVLPRHSDGIAIGQQGGIGHIFRKTPVNLECSRGHFATILEQLFDLSL